MKYCSSKKEVTTDICNNMDKSQMHPVKEARIKRLHKV